MPEYNVKGGQRICFISWPKHDWMKDAHFLNQMWFFQQFRNYIDQLEQPGGKQYNIQNFMMMYIFGATTNTEYRTRLFDHWPTVASSPNNKEFLDHSSVPSQQYLEDFNECKAIMGYRYLSSGLDDGCQNLSLTDRNTSSKNIYLILEGFLV